MIEESSGGWKAKGRQRSVWSAWAFASGVVRALLHHNTNSSEHWRKRDDLISERTGTNLKLCYCGILPPTNSVTSANLTPLFFSRSVIELTVVMRGSFDSVFLWIFSLFSDVRSGLTLNESNSSSVFLDFLQL